MSQMFFWRSNASKKAHQFFLDCKKQQYQHLVWGDPHFIFSPPVFSCLKIYLPHLFSSDVFFRASPGREDPANPKVLTLNQFNKAITVRFQHTKRFHLSFWAHLKSRIFFCEVLDCPKKNAESFSWKGERSFPNKETNRQTDKQRRY